MNRRKMKRKSREICTSPILDDSPKRTKVHAQRKFAQGSNVNSPVITPIKELEIERPTVLPEPVELLPIKRPNTEDFLTFLCFRGTPILPQNLNFFNTASVVDSNGQVHKIKSESPKNGPIDAPISKCGGSAEKPFIAFGVRKRADPIVISKQMDRKRRHALAIQALRRKYQEQKMAKIRALTISKLSEKVTNKTLVRTNSVSRTETVTKKTNTVQKSQQNVKVIATKHVKVTTRTLKTTIRPNIKQKMCLRSYRGRMVPKELPSKKKIVLDKTTKKADKKSAKKGEAEEEEDEEEEEEEDNFETEEELESSPTAVRKPVRKTLVRKTLRKTIISTPKSQKLQPGSRMTRSGHVINTKVNARIQQIKKRILLTTPSTNSIVKRRALRSTTMKKTVISRKSHTLRTKKHMRRISREDKDTGQVNKETKSPPVETKKIVVPKKDAKTPVKVKEPEMVIKPKEKTPVQKKEPVPKKVIKKDETNKNNKTDKPTPIKKKPAEAKDDKVKKAITPKETVKKTVKGKKENANKETEDTPTEPVKEKEPDNKTETPNKETNVPVKEEKVAVKVTNPDEKPIEIKLEEETVEGNSDIKETKDNIIKSKPTQEPKSKDATIKEEPKRKAVKLEESPVKKQEKPDDSSSPQKSSRPSRKTKEAATIYMEILSHKLGNDSKIDDDNVSIDSFPELPNVKKMEQRENELKAKVKSKEEDKDESPEKYKNKPVKKVVKKVDEETKPATSDEDQDKKIMISKIVEEEMQSVLGDLKKIIKKEKPFEIKPIIKKTSLGKRKSNIDLVIDDKLSSDDEALSNKVRKTEEVKTKPEEIEKRQTRNSQQNKNQISDDSDESFHADVKVSRNKKVTRSKAPKVASTSFEEKGVSEESDQSTTSDVDLNTLKNRQKNKKFTKTKSMKKSDENFSDSDEEPLSKLTHKSVDGSQCSILTKQSKTKAEIIKSDNKPKEVIKRVSRKAVDKTPVEEEPKVKPKRECAKIPQNYLPMYSSSSDEEYFHGFSKKPEEETCDKALPKILEKTLTHLPPSSDLLSSRRFGKEKVNMSNEQIEKWLKDSALAGNSIRKENDEMLKFGEIIPTETTLELQENIDTLKLKSSLLPDITDPKPDSKPEEATSSCVTTPEKLLKPDTPSKTTPLLDRKLIFRKDKKDAAPNINAFSPENESSVYAFGEEAEPILSTPFRRPSRRPSSTATSRSEDESGKLDELIKSGQFRKPLSKQDSKSKEDLLEGSSQAESDDHFNIPQNPTKLKSNLSRGSPANLTKSKISVKSFPKNLDLFDDGKYKVPSSPSASSSSSAKLYKKPPSKAKSRTSEQCLPISVLEFPKSAIPGQLVEAPVFYPTEQEFQDPIEYIEKIRHRAESFGICRIIPPSTFKPECKVQDDMRFTAYYQYVHKMLQRWGPNFKELMAIKKYLATQNISLTPPPCIGGLEIDLPKLYQTVQTLGGLKEVIEKKKWPRVSELMKIPKTTQDRLTKLDDIYCKYLLPYDTLSPAEREKLFDEVETDWAKRESKGLLKAQGTLNEMENEESDDSEHDDLDAEDCIVKGKTIALNAYFRIARNTMNMHFKNPEPPAEEVEQEFWKHVTLRQNHICVQSGSIDTGNWGYGFAITKNSPFARHAWNLKVFTNNSGSVLRSLGPLMGVTVPTLHLGMVFAACCWYRDPHGLPWIEYLHTGGKKIWYGIPDSNAENFRVALKKLMPNYCRNKALWLTSDTAMIPPSLLMENNVSLCRTVQQPGEFVVVFPKAFTSSISTGYVVSESVYFAPPNWLKTARTLFDELRQSSEPSMFSLDRLLLSISTDYRSNVEVLRQIIPHIEELCDKELQSREKLEKFGIKEHEKMPLPEAPNVRKKKRLQGEEGDYECESCRMNLFVSMLFDMKGNATYCLEHAIQLLDNKQVDPTKCKFMFTYDNEELKNMIKSINASIEAKLQKKIPGKYAGMPTLLNK